MTGDQGIALIGGLGALVLVFASLLGRRLPMEKLLKLALVWLALFGAGYLIIRYVIPASFT